MLFCEWKVSNKIRHDAKHHYVGLIPLKYSFLVDISRNIFMHPSKNNNYIYLLVVVSTCAAQLRGLSIVTPNIFSSLEILTVVEFILISAGLS